jgi:hypothetical protein
VAVGRDFAVGKAVLVGFVVQRARRFLPLLVLPLALAWVLTIIMLITLNPVNGTGNPMD